MKYIINCSGQDNVYRNVEPGVVSYGIGVCVFACTCEGSRRFQHFIAEGMKKGSVFVFWSVCSFLLICVVAAVNRGLFPLWHVF